MFYNFTRGGSTQSTLQSSIFVTGNIWRKFSQVVFSFPPHMFSSLINIMAKVQRLDICIIIKSDF